MTYYVAIERINGRFQFANLIQSLNIRGFEERVEYSEGGWQDHMMHVVLPHLKFENNDDALAYVLAFGGEVLSEIPIRLT